MMIRTLFLFGVIGLLLTGAACGEDNDNGPQPMDQGSSTSYGGDTGGSEEPEPDPLEPTAERCGGDAPMEIDPPPDYDGFVRLCSPEVAFNLLVVHNISNTVIVVRAGESNPRLQVQVDGERSLADELVARLGLPDCGDVWCRLPPGHSLHATGLAPVRVYLGIDDAMTASVAFTTSLASIAESKLQSRGRRAAAAAASCAMNTGSAVNAQNWEESFRHALTAAPDCSSLRSMLFQDDVPETTVRRVLKQAQALSGGLWIDAFVRGSQLVR
jgi:hypothetical protein